MNDLSAPEGNDPLKRTHNAPESESLIYMPASEQQQPDALGRCPVCGMPYVLGAAPVSTPLHDSPPASEPAAPSELRVVWLCPHCGTYSVGKPPAR